MRHASAGRLYGRRVRADERVYRSLARHELLLRGGEAARRQIPVQNRVTGEIYESAQFLYILVAACLFSNYPRETRLDYVKRFYDAVSTFKISLPTPIMSGVRTLPVSSAPAF
ncbi:hypothetical protein EIN43_25020 [Enterobacter hormaechei]|uniref:Ribonucleotide reductase large subunit N-terminal domain-containing protein n=1 Tax=Enterobacter hormaechei TaxID=158836 RepID=A0A4Y5ZPN2_9ENTR|nr:hypothetical protein EIN43_25020 [Enterobacter hormaechei]